MYFSLLKHWIVFYGSELDSLLLFCYGTLSSCTFKKNLFLIFKKVLSWKVNKFGNFYFSNEISQWNFQVWEILFFSHLTKCLEDRKHKAFLRMLWIFFHDQLAKFAPNRQPEEGTWPCPLHGRHLAGFRYCVYLASLLLHLSLSPV